MATFEGAGLAGPMLDDIRRQPDVAASLLARQAEFAAFGRDHLTPDPGGRCFVVGSGDGWFAGRAVAADVGARAENTLAFLIEVAPTLTLADRVLAVSMSGNVDRTLEAAEATLARRAGMALLTNGDGGRVGALGVPLVSLDIASLAPFLCGTSSYVASLIALGLVLGGTRDRGAGPEALRTTLARSEAAIMALDLDDVAGVRLLGVGATLATADYGAAKLVEVTRTPAWTDDIEEFAHRQFWTASPHELVVLLVATPAVAAYAEGSASALAEMGFRTLAIVAAEAAVPSASAQLVLPPVGAGAWPELAAVPLQLLAYRLAVAGGLDPNTRAHLKRDERRFRTSRLLTRRSLVGTGL